MTKLDVLRSITFGDRVAEQEGASLEKYFVETDHWKRLYSGDVDVIYGPKGSGKSALYTLLLARSEDLAHRGILLAAAENPRGATAFKDLVVDPPASEPEFIALWKLYLASLVGSVLADAGVSGSEADTLRAALEAEGLIEPGPDLRSRLRRARDYVRRGFRAESIQGGVGIDPATGLPSDFTGKITFREPSRQGAEGGYSSVDRLLALGDDTLAREGRSLWILLDRLDVAFIDNPQLEQNALRALFHVYIDMLGLRSLALKIFLRTDIWRRITTAGFREASHITRDMTISWNPQSLLHLVVSRAIQNTSVQDHYGVTPADVLASHSKQQTFFYRVFPSQVDVGSRKPQTFEWVLSRTRDGTGYTAPREVIHLLGSLKAEQARRLEIGDEEPGNGLLFSRAAFKDALREVSRARLEQTLYAEYPELKPPLEKLRGGKTQHSLGSLSRVWGVSDAEAQATAQHLVEVGFFEVRRARTASEYWVPVLYRPGLDLVQGRAQAD